MRTVTLTEFRKQASGLLTEVEQGQSLVIIRHGQPIAEMIPYRVPSSPQPAWKQPALRLQRRGAELSAAILAERESEE